MEPIIGMMVIFIGIIFIVFSSYEKKTGKEILTLYTTHIFTYNDKTAKSFFLILKFIIGLILILTGLFFLLL